MFKSTRKLTDCFFSSEIVLRVPITVDPAQSFPETGAARAFPTFRIRMESVRRTVPGRMKGLMTAMSATRSTSRRTHGWAPENKTRQIVTLRVLLPVHKLLGRLHIQRVTDDMVSAMGCGAKANNLRAESDRTIVLIDRLVMKRNANTHQSAPTDRAWTASASVDVARKSLAAGRRQLAFNRNCKLSRNSCSPDRIMGVNVHFFSVPVLTHRVLYGS